MACRKRDGIEAKGIERKCVMPGVSWGARPVSRPRVGWVKVCGVKAVMLLSGHAIQVRR